MNIGGNVRPGLVSSARLPPIFLGVFCVFFGSLTRERPQVSLPPIFLGVFCAFSGSLPRERPQASLPPIFLGVFCAFFGSLTPRPDPTLEAQTARHVRSPARPGRYKGKPFPEGVWHTGKSPVGIKIPIPEARLYSASESRRAASAMGMNNRMGTLAKGRNPRC